MATADRIIDLLHEAKARPAGGERERFLDEACGDDAALKEQIVSLLEAGDDDGDSNFLKITRIIRPEFLPTEKPGDRIGRYKLLEQIGEGGCGVVYMAEQEEPVRRRVALKVIKLGMDTKQVIARFEAERQALAMMDHPNIAKVLDGGATEKGRPYFVMELVRGIRITDYCDQNNLSTNERLGLFIEVCQAIQHAHQKGIIHRDIKPSNVLVRLPEGNTGVPPVPVRGHPACGNKAGGTPASQHSRDGCVPDGTPVVKVIDFGIARATTGQRLSDKTIFTAFEQFIGTPAYMSPEQAMMTSLDIDTRTDIYALGVLLYELLTGQTPFDATELMAAGLDAMRRIIREQEPARPSTRLSTMLAADLTAIARHRQAEPARLGTLLRGDLDWIVMKALEKDRTRRYETANSLAVDIQRHLINEPVVARPPGTAYRFQKLVRRNRALFAAAATVFVVVLAGMVVSIQLLRGENEAMRRALLAEESAKAERKRNDQATRSLTQSGTALLKQGDLEAAEMWLLEALAMRRTPPDGGDKQTADILSALAHLRHWQRDFVEVERLAGESAAIRRRLQQDDPALARTLNFLADSRYELGDLPDAERLFREALAIMRRNGSDEPGTLTWSLYALAETVERQGRFVEAEPLYQELLTRPGAGEPIDDSVLSPAAGSTRCLIELAWLEQQQGRSGQAISRARAAEAILRDGLSKLPESAENRTWQSKEMKSRLGGALAVALAADTGLQPASRLSEFARIETLLLESEQQLRDDPAVHSNFKRDACERLVRFYEVWNAAAPGTGNAEKALDWRRRLAALKP